MATPLEPSVAAGPDEPCRHCWAFWAQRLPSPREQRKGPDQSNVPTLTEPTPDETTILHFRQLLERHLAGAVVGDAAVLPTGLVTVLAGGATAAVLLVMRRVERRDRVPDGPFIAVGAVAALLG